MSVIGNYVFGYNPYQEVTFDYTFDAVEQPIAETHSDGTGFFIGAGIGVFLGKL